MKDLIYLDYAATTPVDPRVVDSMSRYLMREGHFGNAGSIHPFGKAAKLAIDNARCQVADLIHAEPNEIIWTSGATEANNLALKGMMAFFKGQDKHIITLKTEHPSVLDTCQSLEKQGIEVTYLEPDSRGLISLETLQAAVKENTLLVSIMHVNNELGVIQHIQQISEYTRARGIVLHVDAAQSVGKIEINVQQTPIDLMSFCAHKIYGPKGIGALFVRRKPRIRLAAQIHGGGQEQGMRSGTLPVHQIVGFGEALHIAKQSMFADYQKIKKLRDYFLEKIQTLNFFMNGDIHQSYPGIVNICFQNIAAEYFFQQLPHVALSTGSACHAKNTGGSYVLRALGLNEMNARRSIRFSFGRYTEKHEIELLAHDLMHFMY